MSGARRGAAVLLAAGGCLAIAACGSSGGGSTSTSAATTGAGAAGAPTGAQEGVPSFGHVFLIVGENTSLSQITAQHAPYLTGTLRPRAAWLTDYHAFGNLSSGGQYIGMTSGQFIKCEANDAPPLHCNQNVPNLFGQLDAAHLPWIAWNESADNACDFVDHGADWAKNVFSAHHEPAIYYTGIQGGKYDEGIAPSHECLTRDLPMGTTAPNDTSAFDRALASGSVGNFNLVISNDCENGHDPCGTSDPVKQFDDFLAREVPKIESSPAFGDSGLIMITWDEGADPPLDPMHVLALAVGPQVMPGTYSQGPFDHYAMLRTIEDGFGLAHLGAAKAASPIAQIWM